MTSSQIFSLSFLVPDAYVSMRLDARNMMVLSIFSFLVEKKLFANELILLKNSTLFDQ